MQIIERARSAVNTGNRWAHAKVAAVTALAFAGATSAHAALPDAVATSIEAAKVDMLAAVGLVIGAMVAVWGLLKLASKLGWR